MVAVPDLLVIAVPIVVDSVVSVNVIVRYGIGMDNVAVSVVCEPASTKNGLAENSLTEGYPTSGGSMQSIVEPFI
jgi:hypothetical protein